MLVEEIMEKEVITLPPTATIAKALQLLQKHKIRHITITDSNRRVVGIVSDRDVRDASPSIFDKDSKKVELENEISTIMSSPVVTIHPLDFIEEVARIFYYKEFAALPVVSNNQLVGIITEKHMLYTLIQLSGTHVQSSQIKVKVPHRPGVLPEVASFFSERRINIISLLIYPYKDDPNHKIIVFRFQTIDPKPIINDLRNAGYQLMWPNNIPEPKV